MKPIRRRKLIIRKIVLSVWSYFSKIPLTNSLALSLTSSRLSPPGAFLTLGLLIGIINTVRIDKQKKAKAIMDEKIKVALAKKAAKKAALEVQEIEDSYKINFKEVVTNEWVINISIYIIFSSKYYMLNNFDGINYNILVTLQWASTVLKKKGFLNRRNALIFCRF